MCPANGYEHQPGFLVPVLLQSNESKILPLMNVSHPEFNILGFLVPLSLVAGVVGFVVAWFVVAILERCRLTRYLGNISLFFIALSVLFAGLTDWLVNL